MKSKGFTIIEVIAVVIIIGVLATLGLPVFQNVMEDSAAQVCETNLKAVKAALDIYVTERDTVPGSLSALPGSYLNQAYARVMAKQGWRVKLAYFIVNLKDRGFAYAAGLGLQNKGILTCPKDKTPPSQGGISYGINPNLAGMTSLQYRKIPVDVVLVADCDEATLNGSNIVSRHTMYSLGIPKANSYADGVQSLGIVNPYKKDSTVTLYISPAVEAPTESSCKNSCQYMKDQCDSWWHWGKCEEVYKDCEHACKKFKHGDD